MRKLSYSPHLLKLKAILKRNNIYGLVDSSNLNNVCSFLHTKKNLKQRKSQRIVKNLFRDSIVLKYFLESSNYSVLTKNFIRFRKCLLKRYNFKSNIQNTCYFTGRSRGYFKRFGVSRILLRSLVNRGKISGVSKKV